MSRMILRIVLAIGGAILLSVAGVNGNDVVLQTLFTVLGIVFSISMSLLVSFSLTKILNKNIRANLRFSISHTRNMLLLDFTISTLASVVALTCDKDILRCTIKGVVVDIMLIAVLLVATSLLYEIYNFSKLHKLHMDIEDAVIEEETNKAR